MKVSVIMGSKSDLPIVEPAVKILKEFDVSVEVRCLSAHRLHNELMSYVGECNSNGTEVIIAAAGMAAALPGVIASATIIPVIGVPVKNDTLGGIDALLSIVQMPTGVPVATVAINGSKNAAYLALQILAIKYQNIKNKLLDAKEKMQNDALIANQEVIEKY